MGAKPNWTPEEKQYLTENWGSVSVDTLCKNLSRSKNSVTVMKNRLKLGAFLDSGDYITFHQLMQAIGHTGADTYKSISWINNRGFPVKFKKGRPM